MTDKNKSNLINNYIKKVKSVEYLGGKCLKCGENDIFKMCFHHKNPEEREYRWKELKYKPYSKIVKELDKCEVLCFNCHHELHYNENIETITEDGLKIRKSKEILLSIKEKAECIKCGYNKCIASLDFHHRIKNDKLLLVSKTAMRVKDQLDISEKILNEINKCDILCRSCHNKEHSNIEIINDNIDYINMKLLNFKPYVKLNHEEIYKLYLSGNGVVKISKIFNVNKSTISTIIKKYKNNDCLARMA